MKGDKVNCLECGTEFIKKSVKNVYCRFSCSQEYSLKRRHEKMPVNRFAIFKRDDFRCMYCGKSSIEDKAKLVIDHLMPTARGGLNLPTNVVTACRECNSEKHAKILSDDVLERIRTQIKK